jgi:hypothetical protein
LQATLNTPTDAWQDIDGSILVSDSGNNRIRKLMPMGVAPIVSSPLRVLHGLTGKEEPVSPGQIAFLEADEPFPFSTMGVWFGELAAKVVASTPARITVIVPESLAPGWTEVRVEQWAAAPVEIASSTPTLAGEIENDDGSINSAAEPASRTGLLKLRVSGISGTAVPVVSAQITYIDIPVVSTERAAAQLMIQLQLPGGFLPSGSSPLSLVIDGRTVAGRLNVVIR